MNDTPYPKRSILQKKKFIKKLIDSSEDINSIEKILPVLLELNAKLPEAVDEVKNFVEFRLSESKKEKQRPSAQILPFKKEQDIGFITTGAINFLRDNRTQMLYDILEFIEDQNLGSQSDVAEAGVVGGKE